MRRHDSLFSVLLLKKSLSFSRQLIYIRYGSHCRHSEGAAQLASSKSSGAAMKKQYLHAVGKPPITKMKYSHYCKSVAEGRIKLGHPAFATTLVKISAYKAWQVRAGIKARTTLIMSAVDTLLHTTCSICRSAECDGQVCAPVHCMPPVTTERPSGGEKQTDMASEVELDKEEARNSKLRERVFA